MCMIFVRAALIILRSLMKFRQIPSASAHLFTLSATVKSKSNHRAQNSIQFQRRGELFARRRAV